MLIWYTLNAFQREVKMGINSIKQMIVIGLTFDYLLFIFQKACKVMEIQDFFLIAVGDQNQVEVSACGNHLVEWTKFIKAERALVLVRVCFLQIVAKTFYDVCLSLSTFWMIYLSASKQSSFTGGGGEDGQWATATKAILRYNKGHLWQPYGLPVIAFSTVPTKTLNAHICLLAPSVAFYASLYIIMGWWEAWEDHRESLLKDFTYFFIR